MRPDDIHDRMHPKGLQIIFIIKFLVVAKTVCVVLLLDVVIRSLGQDRFSVSSGIGHRRRNSIGSQYIYRGKTCMIIQLEEDEIPLRYLLACT